MLIEVNAKSQLTIPTEVIEKMGFYEGDLFEVTVRDGVVFLFPTVVYPESTTERLKQVIASHDHENLIAYDNADEMLAAMGIKDENVPA